MNIPLCSALTHSPKKIARIFKHAFFEYLNYAYYRSKHTFCNRICSHFEIRRNNFEDMNDREIKHIDDYDNNFIDDDDKNICDLIMNCGYRLKTKDIEKCIHREWFSNIGENIFVTAKSHKSIQQFNIGIVIKTDLKEEYIPFSYEKLIELQKICPTIYKKLEQFGELKCPYLPMSNPIRQYIYWHKINERYIEDDDFNEYDEDGELLPEVAESYDKIRIIFKKYFNNLGYKSYEFHGYPLPISTIFEYIVNYRKIN
jgi:hypothetical protein